MPSLLSKLRSFKNSHSYSNLQQQQQPSDQALDLDLFKPQIPDWTARRTFSISPKLRTFFEPPQTRTKTTSNGRSTTTAFLGVLESPQAQSPQCPESAYSGVVTQVLGVEVVRRVSGGKVKRVKVGNVREYESVCVGTQTRTGDSVAAANGLKLNSGPVNGGWEPDGMLHSRGAGLWFLPDNTVKQQQQQPAGELGQLSGREAHAKGPSLPLPSAFLLLQLNNAITASASLHSTRQRTAREIATLTTYQEDLRKHKEALRSRLQVLKETPDGAKLDFKEKLAVDRELVRVSRGLIDTLDERLSSEERLEVERETFEGIVKAAIGGLEGWLRGSGLLVDVEVGGVDGGGGRKRTVSEIEFERKHCLE